MPPSTGCSCNLSDMSLSLVAYYWLARSSIGIFSKNGDFLKGKGYLERGDLSVQLNIPSDRYGRGGGGGGGVFLHKIAYSLMKQLNILTG